MRSTFRNVYCPIDDPVQIFTRVGLPNNATLGDTILPREVGPVSRFNSDGKWVVHKDQPMEPRVVGQKIWRWREFRGRYDYVDQERIVDDERMCYPREFVPPPALELTVQVVQDRLRLVTELFENSAPELIKHAVNLFLELFGQCHLTDTPDEVPIVIPRKVNWRLLPEGANPWERARRAVDEKVRESSPDQQYIISERQRFICSFEPEEVYVGEGGFSAYLAYVFAAKMLTVLESVSSGNAIYIFEGEWRALSQLSKRQILDGGLHKASIIHATGWPEQLAAILR